ncbi:uncharacterized protein LOC119102157, partial [Pollicipes pollicipes]|uniref:uncharacterized protein LOC119102157 n=1 Tax=Pollicipes pollicipes TaxID=41117 RepID=UPI001884F450
CQRDVTSAVRCQRAAIALVAVFVAVNDVQGAVFSVGHANAIGRAGNLRFTNIMADDVKGWRFQEGYYECRERGYYYVSFHGLSTHAVPTTLVLHKNSEEVLAGYGSGTDYSTASNSGIVLLGLGDKLSLHVITGDIHESENSRRNYVTLSGFKVADSPGGPVGPPGAIGAAGSLGAG